MSTPIDWPSTLPCILRENYTVSPRSPVLQTDFGMNTRRRVVYSDALEEAAITLILNAEQEQEFRTFRDYTCEFGTLAFNLTLLANGEMLSREVQFIGDPPSYAQIGRRLVRISFTVLSRAGFTPPA